MERSEGNFSLFYPHLQYWKVCFIKTKKSNIVGYKFNAGRINWYRAVYLYAELAVKVALQGRFLYLTTLRAFAREKSLGFGVIAFFQGIMYTVKLKRGLVIHLKLKYLYIYISQIRLFNTVQYEIEKFDIKFNKLRHHV